MKKFKPIIFIVILLLLIGLIFRLLTPPPSQVANQPIPPNFDGSTTTFSKIAFTGDEPLVPTSLPIGLVNLSSNKVSFLNTILSKYNLQPVSENLWESDEYRLSYSPQSDQFVLVITSPPSQTGVVNQLAAKKVADDFLLSVFNGNPSFQPVVGSTKFMSGFPESTFVAPGLASFITNNYSQTVSEIPIVLDVSTSFPLSLTIDSDLRITKMTYQPQYADFYEQSITNTISINEAIKNINRNQGAVISAFGEETAFFSLESVTDGVMDSVDLEYRVLSDNNLAVPYFRFSGTATTGDGNTVEVQIITPAYRA